MAGSLREPLNPEQEHLVRVIFEQFDRTGEWPIWQYVDLTLESRFGVDNAADVLASLPSVGERGPASLSYGLTWRLDSYAPVRLDVPIALTVAGLRYVPEAEHLLQSFLTTIRHFVDRKRNLVPSPTKVVEATVTSAEIRNEVSAASIGAGAAPPVEATMHKLRQLLAHEPFLYAVVHKPEPLKEEWTVRVPAVLRAYRGLVTIDDYLDRVIEQVAPPGPPNVPLSFGALDIPYAVGYLDAVWKYRTGSHLFVNLDPASVARLTQECGSEEEFNSLMSALADVLGQVVKPGQASPPQGGALEAVRDYLSAVLDVEAADRVTAAIGRLIHLRRLRVSAQHGDARHRAVTAFQQIGLAFPPVSWQAAWERVAVTAKGALDVLREEIHVGLPST
ncbi:MULTISPECIES: hypothetical protein [Micromonospora]|uniref:Uncharacterized protein n=1 Tax=Micromonospora chalcea TaxID=1874 RepID=A0ABX9Y990_MICCH|nr:MULTISPECIES: hypothetical protein [Micromonospora]ODB80079.1 hypothetical protein A8711_22650 [Micromonospora sp. II]RQW96392.1 hypothetical protein DLJ60_05415 [Micromonospora chalcea]RQX54702.1 hypothetical protein DLJ57_08115 [Micromonospora chalcea]